MKNKKINNNGFSLMELLAVIVLLGIIMAIAVAGISNIMHKSKLKTSMISAENYVRGIEHSFNGEEEKGEVSWLFVGNSALANVLESGVYPQDGVITMFNNKVVEAKLCYDNLSVSYSDGEYSVKNDNSFCEYTQNAVVKYMDEKGVEIEDVDYDKLDVDVSTLTEENRIFGKQYINPEYIKYIEYLEEKPEEEEDKYTVIPETHIDPTWQVAELLEESEEGLTNVSSNKSSSVVDKLNNNRTTASVKKMASYKDKKYRVDVEGGLNLIMENQRDSSLCWAYTTTTMFEGALQKNFSGTSNIQMSTRHLDHFLAKSFTTEREYLDKSKYVEVLAPTVNLKGESTYRDIATGGNFNMSMSTMFTGLSIQESSSFADNLFDYSMKPVSSIYNSNKITYYPKKVTNLINNSYSTTAVTALKKSLINNGPAYGSIYYHTSVVKQNDSLPPLYNGKAFILGADVTSATNHAVTVIGWDDNVGAWIVQNSHGNVDRAYFYVDYKYEKLYEKLATFKEIGVKDWDNSYDYINNIKTTSDSSALYINKVNNGEKIVNIGFMRSDSDYKSSEPYYFLSATDENQCKTMASNINNNVYTINNNVVYNNNQNIGFVVNSPKLNTIGYEINPTNQSMIFENDICIVNTGKNYKNAISVFTKNTQGVSSKVEMTVEKVDSLGNHNVETMVNGNSGAIVEYVILDSNGNDAIANKEVEIYDNVVVNNVAHAKIKFNYQYQYKIISKINGVASNEVIINEGLLKPEDKPASEQPTAPPVVVEPVVPKDVTAPVCAWSSSLYKVTSKLKGTFVIKCIDDSGFSDSSISKSDIQVSGLLLKKLKVESVTKQNSSDSKTIYYTVTAKRTLLGFGNSTLTLKKNTVSDTSGNKNSAVTTQNISVKLK